VKLGVKEDKEGNTIYTIPPRLEGEGPVELNMSNKNNEKLFYNMLLGVTKMGTGNSAKDKLFRKQFEAALEKGTTKKIQAKKEKDAAETANFPTMMGRPKEGEEEVTEIIKGFAKYD